MNRVPCRLSLLLTLACAAWVCGGAPAPPPAAAPAPPPRPVHALTLADTVKAALEKNLQLASEKLNPERAGTIIVEERAVFDPTFSANFNRAKVNAQTRGSAQDNPSSLFESFLPTTAEGGAASSDVVLPYYRTQQWTGDVRLSKRLTPGTTLEIYKDWTKDWDDHPFTGISPAYTESAGLQLTQPLLRGFGVYVNTARITTAINQRRTAVAALHEVALGTVSDAVKTYWELVFAIGNRKLLEASLDRAQRLQQDVQARVDARVLGERDPSVAQAAAGVAVREEAIIVADDTIRDTEDVLKVLTDIVADPTLWGHAIDPVATPPRTADPIDVEQAVRTALEHRPDYEQLKIAIETSDVGILVRRNELLPILDLSGKIATQGLGPEWHRSRYHMGTLDHYEMAFGLKFEYALGNRAAQARLRRAKLERQQAVVNVASLERKIQLEVRRAIRQVATDLERLRTSRLSVAAEQERLRAENIRFREARVGTLQDVLDAEAALAESQSRQLRAIIDLNQAIVDVDRSRGTLLDTYHVTIEDVSTAP